MRRVAGSSITPGPEPVVDGECADEEQAPGHQHVADEENPGHGVERQREERESKQVQTRDPALVGRDGRHHLRPSPAQQLVKRDDLQSLFAHAFDDSGESQNGLFAIAPAIVQQDDVAAVNVVGRAGRQVGQHIGGDLIGAVARIVAPVVGIDLVADGDVAHVLRDLERADLVFGVGFGVNRIRRAKQNRANAQAAGKKLLGKIQFHRAHESPRNVADVGMSKRMVPDFVALAVDAVGDVGKFVGLNPDQKKRGRRLFALKHIQNLGGPFRVRAIVEGEGDFVRARSVARHPVGLRQRVESFDR